MLGEVREDDSGKVQCPGFNDQGMSEVEKIQFRPSESVAAFVIGTWALHGSLASWALVIPTSIAGLTIGQPWRSTR